MSGPEILPVPGLPPAPAPRAVSFIARGDPAPQGSKSAFPVAATVRPPSRGVHCPRCKTPLHIHFNQAESSKGVEPWREQVAMAARLAMRGADPLSGPLVVAMTFTLGRPRSHSGTGKNAGVLKDSAPGCPAIRPDISKLVRAAEDAMTGIVWQDDAQVTDYVRAAKVYPAAREGTARLPLAGSGLASIAGVPGADALTSPGAVIRVSGIWS